METLLIAISIIVVSIIAGYGYYLIFTKELKEFDEKRKTRTQYRTNEEFIQG
jgi:Tfp pilus assembly protein PilO